MIVFLFIISYLLLGLASARAVFVNKLGDSPRTYQKQEYKNLYVVNDFSKKTVTEETDEFRDAITMAVWTIPFCFVIIPLWFLIQAPTPHEKALKKQKQQMDLEERFKQLEVDVLKFGTKL